ncbi:MAG: hypothetical protein P9L90_04970 [Candidatus Aadella gelida]|nr:hypothetical protein [Candidatus Aadella gelida]
MIDREAKYYTAGQDVNDPRNAPFYLRALVFDGQENEFGVGLVEEFNGFIKEKYSDKLNYDSCEKYCDIPKKIIIVNASHDKLPTSDETARVFKDVLEKKRCDIPVRVVNKKEDLLAELEEDDNEILIVSQCVDKNVYNSDMVELLEKKGAVIVPGKTTAPGSVFSDKDSTYRLLSDNGKVWDEVARYRKVETENKTIELTVDGIFRAIDELVEETGDTTFFVKPHEGGGGLGGFRITVTDKGYIIPDLSKVSGDSSDIKPTFIDIDVEGEAKLKEILWVYRLFAGDKKLSANYIGVDLDITDDEASSLKVIKEYLVRSKARKKEKLESMTMDKGTVRAALINAIGIFEKKFGRKYVPLVNEYLDFGLWGLRAHYRLSTEGILLETMYHRVFQVAFTEEGLGYVGSDNISNKQTGELEILRLGPVNSVMLGAIGGKTSLFDTLGKGAGALVLLSGLLSDEEKVKTPLRVQLDLAAVSHRIGEGNADTARGLCLASRWSEFVKNTEEWLEDSLRYYAWKKKE